MNKMEIAQAVAGYHNLLSEISVHGEDVLRLRDVLIGMRNLTSQLVQEANEQASHEEPAEEAK